MRGEHGTSDRMANSPRWDRNPGRETPIPRLELGRRSEIAYNKTTSILPVAGVLKDHPGLEHVPQ